MYRIVAALGRLVTKVTERRSGSEMNDELKRTIRIKKPRVETDERGRTVWADPVETTELELMSTTMLRKMIDSGDEARKQRLHEAAEQKDGVLARDTGNGEFQIIDDDDLKAALKSADDPEAGTADVVMEQIPLGTGGEEELSLVSTQALRHMLDKDHTPDDEPEDAEIEENRNFDPYNSS